MNSKPIGTTTDQVTEIKVESKDMPRGQVKFEKAKKPRPRRWLITWRDETRPTGRTITAHDAAYRHIRRK